MRKVFVKNLTGFQIELSDASNEILEANNGKSNFKNEETFLLLETSAYPEIIVYSNGDCETFFSNGFTDANGDKHIEFYMEVI